MRHYQAAIEINSRVTRALFQNSNEISKPAAGFIYINGLGHKVSM